MKAEQQLLDSYLDGELTPDEERRLAEWLAADAEHIRRFVRETSLHRQIRETKLARPYHAYGVSEIESAELKKRQSPIRLRFLPQWIISKARQVGRVTPCAPQTQIRLPNGAHGVTRLANYFAEFIDRRAGWSLATAAVVLCVLVLPGFLRTQGVPELASVSGAEIQIMRSGQSLAAEIGLRLRPNDVIRTTGEGRAVITYGREATRIDLETNSELKLLSWKSGKRFDLRAGKLEATVARQRPFQPMIISTPQAEARVLGTKFTLTTTTNATRLDVDEGEVRLTRPSDGALADVPADYYAVAAVGYELSALPQTGSILREYWTNLPGDYYITFLTSHRDYPDRPSGREYLNKFDAPSHWGTNYGARIRGYLHLPKTGDYTFWIAAGDGGELWLSPDDKPENKRQMGYAKFSAPHEWTKHRGQQSSSIPLVAGRKYYIEALQKQGTKREDHFAVAWQRPGREREVIPGEFLSPFPVKEKKR